MRNFTALILAMALSVPSISFAAPIYQKDTIYPYKNFVESFSETVSLPGTGNKHYGIFGITFTIQATGEDLYLPTTALRTRNAVLNDRSGVRYDIFDSEGNPYKSGISGAMVIGDKTPVDGYFKVAKGTTETFTLLGILDTEGAPIQPETYQMRLDSFRYYLRSPSTNPVTDNYGFEKFKTKEVEL